MSDFAYEEQRLECKNCGQLVKLVIYPGFDTEHFLCPKCSVGDAYFEVEGDI